MGHAIGHCGLPRFRASQKLSADTDSLSQPRPKYTNRAMNRAVNTYTNQFTSRNLPANIFSSVYAVNPNARPFAMLNVNGIVIIVRKAGIATSGSLHAISPTADTIRLPTIRSEERRVGKEWRYRWS